jgi:hypothetical protein
MKISSQKKKLNHGKVLQIVLHAVNRKLFMSMLNDCYKYAAAINAKVQPFTTESLIMAMLLLSQHIKSLTG